MINNLQEVNDYLLREMFEALQDILEWWKKGGGPDDFIVPASSINSRLAFIEEMLRQMPEYADPDIDIYGRAIAHGLKGLNSSQQECMGSFIASAHKEYRSKGFHRA